MKKRNQKSTFSPAHVIISMFSDGQKNQYTSYKVPYNMVTPLFSVEEKTPTDDYNSNNLKSFASQYSL